MTPTTTSRFGRIFPDTDGCARAIFERPLPTDAADAWSVITDPDRLSRWLAPVIIEADRYRIDFGDDAEDQVGGSIRVCEPDHRLVVSWEIEGVGETLVEATLEHQPEAGATVLRIEHSGLPIGSAHGYGAGWHVHLDDLQSIFTGEVPSDSWNDRWSGLAPTCREQLHRA